MPGLGGRLGEEKGKLGFQVLEEESRSPCETVLERSPASGSKARGWKQWIGFSILSHEISP